MEKFKTDFYEELLSKDEFSRLQITASDFKLEDEFSTFLIKNFQTYFTSNQENYYFPTNFVTLKDFRMYEKRSLNKKMTDADVSLKLNKPKIDTNEQNGVLVPKASEIGVLFRTAYTQVVDMKFIMTNYGCYICQQNFFSLTEYDDHIRIHGNDEYEIPASSWYKCSFPTFSISYDHNVDSNLLNFKMKSSKDIVIERIVIVRTEFRKLMRYIDKSKIQISKENRTFNFSVDCFLFDIAKEHPFFIIYRNSDEVSTRKIEKYIFFRKEQFPKSKISVISSSVPHNAQLQIKNKIRQHFPSVEVRSLWQKHYQEINIMNTNSIMMQYVLERRLKETNYTQVLSFLLQMEDQSLLGNYEKFILTNPAIQHLGSLDYSITFPQKIRNESDKFVSQFDDVVVTTIPSESFYDDEAFETKRTKKFERFVGYIYKVKNNTIFFSLRTKMNIPKKSKFKVKIYPHRMPLRFQHDAIRRMNKYNHILRVLLPPEDATAEVSSVTLNFFNKSIEKNPEQSQAVRNIVGNLTPSVPYILFGPPGTGKSTTIVETVLQLWQTKPSSKILVTSSSNAACDEVAKRLCKIFDDINSEGLNLLRIYAVSYERKIDNSDELLFEASNFAHGYHFYPSLESIYLFRIVVATLTTCGKLIQGDISDSHFTHIFIDECAASTEPETLIGIVGLMGPNSKLILSGDPKQLGPVLKCEQAESFGLGISMMERLLSMKCFQVNPDTNEYDRSLQTILRRNYRSNAEILSISNQLCYNSQLLACAKPGITEWATGWKNLPTKKCPILFHVVHGETVVEKGDPSSKNLAEIRIVMRYVREILKKGINGRRVTQKEIGVISPYKKQCTLIRRFLDSERYSNVETGSAENFQGQEKPIIIISTVKSWKNIGFLKNVKRLNVMLTRAQALMIIVGNPETLQKDENWNQVLQYFQTKNAFIGKEFKLQSASISFNVDLLPNTPKTNNSITNKEINYQQKKIVDVHIDTHRQQETPKLESSLQNSHQYNNKVDWNQHAKYNPKAEKNRPGSVKRVDEKVEFFSTLSSLSLEDLEQHQKTNAASNNSPNFINYVQGNFVKTKSKEESDIKIDQLEQTSTSKEAVKAIDPNKVATLQLENLQNCQQNNSIVAHSSNLNSNNQQNLEDPKLHKIFNNSEEEMNPFLKSLCKDKSTLLLENKDKEDFVQLSKEELFLTSSNNLKTEIRRRRKSIQNEREPFETSLLLEDLEDIPQQNNKSLNSNHSDQLIFKKNNNEKRSAENDIGLERFSLENVAKTKSVPIPTATVRPMTCNSTENMGTNCKKEMTTSANSEKTKREKEKIKPFYARTSLLGDFENSDKLSIQQHLNDPKVNDTHSNVDSHRVCVEDTFIEDPVFVPTATVRPVLKEVCAEQFKFVNHLQRCSYPSEEEWQDLSPYTRCPPLNNYYEKPKAKDENNCVIL